MDKADNKVKKPRPGHGATQPNTQSSDHTTIRPRPRPGGTATPSKPLIDNNDNTVIRPRKTRTSNTPISLTVPNDNDILKQSPLIDAASPLLSLTPQLRQLEGQIDVHSLHQHIKQLMDNFKKKINNLIDDTQIRNDALYILCSLIDETVLNTPWGENSAWSQKPLLSFFHKETYGGEKVYTILENAILTPTKHYELIELIYLSLSLGFLGKLRIDPQGSIKVDQIRAEAYNVLHKSRDRYKKKLSKNIAPTTELKSKLYSLLPIWLFIATLTLIAFAFYSYWLIELNKRSDEMGFKLAGLTPNSQETQLSNAELRPETIALRQLLAPEIERNLLSVEEYRSHTSIILHAGELFGSGSTAIHEAFYPILDKISKALEATPGRIIVAGHTDNVAIRSPRYPSNWHLSLARASSVVQYMDEAASLKARLLPEGRGENEPIASNENAEGRAKNRRVAIDIYHELNNKP
ncbi:Outer membrane protein ImpK/VasF, OmpA/MotB domain [hydrothermal vent metagenome]|uniref:Outer membrane protein ImpK/VasF, OmpA/MotB domain n=1 Tax=hydrothermal vent metagenome TaxID=652676 RepID=A0A3B0VP24_9ZZZZ